MFDFFLLRKCQLEIEHRMWTFDTIHQEEVHNRLRDDGTSNSLAMDQSLIQCDFGSKHKKRTHRYMSLAENRAMPSFSTELHQEFEHIDGISSPDDAKLRVTRHYFLADDCTQCGTQAVTNKSIVLKSVKTKNPGVKSAIYLSDGGNQYLIFYVLFSIFMS